MTHTLETDIAIIGAGTAGMYALSEVRRAGRDFLLIDHGPLGTTCARVGCMPSKAALQVGGTWAGRQALQRIAARGTDALRLDREAAWARVRTLRDRFAGSAAREAREAAGERFICANARFLEPTLLELNRADGTRQRLRAQRVIIATGSSPVMPRWLDPVAARCLTTDDIFDLEVLPDRIAVLGLGAVGLEMGLALARLGLRVTGADLARHPGGIRDAAIGARASARFAAEMDLWLGAETRVEPAPDGVRLRAGERHVDAPALLVALGRRPQLAGLDLEAAGFALDARGVPRFDPATLQVEGLPVFIAGDVNARRPLLHEAQRQGALAGFNAARAEPLRAAAAVPLQIAFCAPDIVQVGAAPDALDAVDLLVGKADGSSNGRSIITGDEDNLLHVYARADNGRLLGAAMLCSGGEHLGQLLALAIQQRLTARQLLSTSFYHPTVEEMLQAALRDIARRQADTGPLPFGLAPARPD